MASSARIEELRKKFEENPRRYFAPLANEYRKAGDVDEAIAICRDYLPQQPGHMSGHIVYGQALYEARQYEEAKSVFETALALDPENLIALRHLGDICLLIGDIEGARGWYGRVLEADPRNEEIQAQLQSLETSSAPGTASAEPTPMSSPAVPAAGAEQPVPAVVDSLSTAPTVVVSPPTFAVEKTAEPPVMSARNEEPTVARTPAGATQSIELDRVVPEVPAAPATDSPRLEGLETTSIGPVHTPVEEPRDPSTVPLMDIELSVPAESAKPGGESSPAASSPPSAFSTDLPMIDLGEPARAADSESGDGDTAGTPPGDAMVEATAEALSVTRPEAAPATRAAAAGPETAPALPAEASTPAAPATPAEAPSPVAESRPFVTETMAELYEQQGHREEALGVYRALLAQRPGDAVLQGKIDALLSRQGPTIRELLARVASRRPASAASAASTQAPAETMDEFSGIPAAGDQAMDVPEPAAGRAAAMPADTASGSAAGADREESRAEVARSDAFAALFGSAPVSSRDETAAQTLAGVFARLGQTPRGALDGAPARPAARDLSLDSVFGKEGGPQPSTFSFDQFFSHRSTQGPATPEQGTGSAPESADDVAKFTQWLEGLKPR